jgi:hypothetical protein
VGLLIHHFPSAINGTYNSTEKGSLNTFMKKYLVKINKPKRNGQLQDIESTNTFLVVRYAMVLFS